MSVILYNASKIRSYENLKALAKFVGETEDFATELWQNMLLDEELLDEFNYFVVNHTIKGAICCGELTLLDVYFSQMNKYNVLHDVGKNTDDCNKDKTVLYAFKKMADMRSDPQFMEKYLRSEQNGMDMI